MRRIHKVCVLTGVCIFSGLTCAVNNLNVCYAKEASLRSVDVSTKTFLNEVIKRYGVFDAYDKEFASYLKKKGISESDYKLCVDFEKTHKDDKIKLFYEIDNLVYAFDTMLYTDPIVKLIYKNNLATYKDKDVAWENTVKGLLYDTTWGRNIYKNSISKYVDIELLFKYKFNREMSKKEQEYAKDPTKLIYLFYSGTLNRDLEDSEISKIKSGKGYEILGITSKEFKEYEKYISKKNQILSVSEGYIKSYKIHEKVRNNIKTKYGIDIFSKLTDWDRKSVYEQALVNYVYSEEKATEVFTSILKSRGYLDSAPFKPSTSITSDSIMNKPDKEHGEKEEDISSGDLPTDKDYEYIEELLKPLGPGSEEIIYSIKESQYTSNYYAKLGTMLDIYKENKDKKVLVVTVGEMNLYTVIEVSEDSISSVDFETVLNQIAIEFSGKRVDSEKEMLIFVNNAIATIMSKEGMYKIEEINDAFKTIGAKLKVVSIEEAMREYLVEIAKEVEEEINEN